MSSDRRDDSKGPQFIRKPAEPPKAGDVDKAKLLEKVAPIVNRQVGGDFTLVSDLDRRNALLRATPFATQASTLWTKERALTRRFFVRRYIEYIDQLECEFTDRASRVLGQVDQQLDMADHNDVYFNIRSEESSLFFNLPRRAISSRGSMLILKLPKTLYEVQRRAQLRYRLSSVESYGFTPTKILGGVSSYSLLDVSSGGIGIRVTWADPSQPALPSLQQGGRFRFRLSLGTIAFETDGEVRYAKSEIDPDTGRPGSRIGLRFVGLAQDTVEALQMFVMERSYQRLSQAFRPE